MIFTFKVLLSKTTLYIDSIHSCCPTDSFKSLTTSADKKEDVEFEQQRRAVIAEALQTKSESTKPKSFTSSKQVILLQILLNKIFVSPHLFVSKISLSFTN